MLQGSYPTSPTLKARLGIVLGCMLAGGLGYVAAFVLRLGLQQQAGIALVAIVAFGGGLLLAAFVLIILLTQHGRRTIIAYEWNDDRLRLRPLLGHSWQSLEADSIAGIGRRTNANRTMFAVRTTDERQFQFDQTRLPGTTELADALERRLQDFRRRTSVATATTPDRRPWRYARRRLYQEGFVGGLIFGTLLTTLAFCVSGFIAVVEIPFLRDGEVVQATVISKVMAFQASLPAHSRFTVLAHGGKKGPRPWLSYRFTTRNGAIVDGRAVVSRDVWDRSKVGAPIMVEYLPDHPEKNRIAGSQSGTRTVAVISGGVGLLFGAVVLKILLRTWNQLSFGMRLIREGAFAPGVIQTVSVVPKDDGWSKVRIEYEFAASDSLAEPSRTIASQIETSTCRPIFYRPGDTFDVFFDERIPARHVAYLLI